MALTKPIVCIENVVATATLNQNLDLNEIKKNFPLINYNPREFPGAVFKINSPKTTTLIFRTGNLVCTGAKSEKHTFLGINNVIEKLRSKIQIKNNPKISIQNIVTTANLGGTILIENAAQILPRSMCEPDQFLGLIHRTLNPKSVLLLFASGKLICTEGKSSSQAFQVISQIHSTLEEKDPISYG